MVSKVLFSSNKSDWETPPELFDKLDKEFHFDLDICATNQNTKCVRFLSANALHPEVGWKVLSNRAIFMNPPYGRQVGQWVRKAYEESRKGATVVCLLPSRTDVEWWHDFVIAGKAEVRFLRGRVRFLLDGVAMKAGAPFPSAVVIFRPPEEAENESVGSSRERVPSWQASSPGSQ